MISSVSLFAQSVLSGQINDAISGESLIGATVIVNNKGVVADYDGLYSIQLEKGKYSVTVSYVGYQKVIKEIVVTNKNIKLNFELSSIQLNEVQVIADIAIDRKTPVAFSTIPLKKLMRI